MTYRFCGLDGDLGHADKGAVEALDGLGGLLRTPVADIANSPVGDELDIGDMAGEIEMLPERRLVYGWRETLDENPRRVHVVVFFGGLRKSRQGSIAVLRKFQHRREDEKKNHLLLVTTYGHKLMIVPPALGTYVLRI